MAGLESCQESNIANGVRLYYIRLAFYLSNSHVLGKEIFLWDIVKLLRNENKMYLNNILIAFIIFLGINSVPRNPSWARVLEFMCTKHAHR